MALDATRKHDLAPGRRIGERYVLGRFLGEGGFAHVYEAEDTQLERPVAIKFLELGRLAAADSDLAERTLQRFEREAKLAAAIRHPNIVQIYEIGAVDGDPRRPFIVMERLEGHDLADHIAIHGALDPVVFVPQFVACLDGLGRAHEQGIVHKDLKPSNLFVHDLGRRTEVLRVVDFGIAHVANPERGASAKRLTATGHILGTPQYLPPEYILDKEVSPALDVYQMTLILIEALSGEYVVDASSSLRCMKIHGDGALELPVYLLDSPLGPMLRRGLALDAIERFPNAHALAQALGQLDPSSIPKAPKVPSAKLERRSLRGGAPSYRPSAQDMPTRRITPGDEALTVPDPEAKSAPFIEEAPREDDEHVSNTVLLVVAAALLMSIGCVGMSLTGIFLVRGQQDEVAARMEANEKAPVITIKAPKKKKSKKRKKKPKDDD